MPSSVALAAGMLLGPALLLQQESLFSVVPFGAELEAAGPAEGEGGAVWAKLTAGHGSGEGMRAQPGGQPGKGMGQLQSSAVMSPMTQSSKAAVVQWGRRSLQIFHGKISCSFQLAQWLPFINLDNLFHPM